MKVRIYTTNVISRAIYTPMRAAIRTENPFGRFRGVRGEFVRITRHKVRMHGKTASYRCKNYFWRINRTRNTISSRNELS